MANHQSWKPKSFAQYATVLLLALCLTLSAVSLLFGLMSWTRIRKWRQFHNYVFLQVIAASIVFITIYFCLRIIYRNQYSAAAEIILATCFNVMLHWQLVTTLVFYLEIVKVITVNISRGYLYIFANLFAWLLPVLEVIIDLRFQKLDLHFMEIIALLIALVISLLYSSVIYILIKNMKARAITGVEVYRHFLVSTFAFLTSGVTLLVPILTALSRQGWSSFWLTEEDIIVTYLLNILAITLFFLSMKNHRELWVEYRSDHSNFSDDIMLI